MNPFHSLPPKVIGVLQEHVRENPINLGLTLRDEDDIGDPSFPRPFHILLPCHLFCPTTNDDDKPDADVTAPWFTSMNNGNIRDR